MYMGKLSSLKPVLSTKVESENSLLKLWENLYNKVMKMAFFSFEQRYCIIRSFVSQSFHVTMYFLRHY